MLITRAREYDYNEMTADLLSLLKNYHYLRIGGIGKSVLDKDIPVIRWGEGDCRVLLCGAHHGNEWITSLLLMRFAEILCKELECENEEITDLYSEASYYIIPMLNPDGVNLSIHGLNEEISDDIRAKLINANDGSEDFKGKWQANIRGVDLNHNYDAAFERGCAFAQKLGILGPGPTRFSGEHPESEPESAALVDFTKKLMPDICAAYHSQGEIIYADFDGKATKRAKRVAAELSRLSGYTLDETEGVASCSGYKDWVINEFYLPAYTIEVGYGKNPLPLSQFDKIVKDNIKMLIFMGQINRF